MTKLIQERINYMPGKKRYIFQRNDIFTFSMDAVLLAKFAKVPKEEGKIVDLCAGNGAVPLMLSLRTNAKIDAVEIQKELCDLAEKSVEYNSLEKQISVINQNIMKLSDEVKWGSYDLVTCNPPYYSINSHNRRNNNEKVSIARHELECTLEDVIRISSRLVKQTGRFAIVHRPERLVEIIMCMIKCSLEPKVLQYVYPKRKKEPNMVFIEAVRNGGPGIKTLEPIYVYDNEGHHYTEEFKNHYEQW
ncbi:tRNA1(Val) (adenine(37)-N6)-methyltransferase [Evansella sp. AB-P1]|uniref:tRNA1(Val) (adenine(37)-N6)-methyltransferase n=1 Tax=Evansella sp. AB-P1 TaxID=3037653 RepID=UPI00241C2F7E|nr:tRNA1(Val) (adenine(37)-N6)-methyltransferase [Evansella sp. AB-P1]MDG5789965.1 tRNA1(Val) (adenine(37)-N6)-methyltransferase [Evansella sp. AB-P1]